MKPKTTQILAYSILTAACLAVVPALVAAEPGTLMALTMRVTESMAGAPAIPPHVMHKRMCLPPGAFNARAFASPGPANSCKTLHYTKNGQLVTFDLTCTSPAPMNSHGEFRLLGGSNFVGAMRTTFSAAGHPVTVITGYTGKQLGTCPYQPSHANG